MNSINKAGLQEKSINKQLDLTCWKSRNTPLWIWYCHYMNIMFQRSKFEKNRNNTKW